MPYSRCSSLFYSLFFSAFFSALNLEKKERELKVGGISNKVLHGAREIILGSDGAFGSTLYGRFSKHWNLGLHKVNMRN